MRLNEGDKWLLQTTGRFFVIRWRWHPQQPQTLTWETPNELQNLMVHKWSILVQLTRLTRLRICNNAVFASDKIETGDVQENKRIPPRCQRCLREAHYHHVNNFRMYFTFSRFGAIASNSSMNRIAGEFFSHSSNALRKFDSDSPASLLIISGPKWRSRYMDVSGAVSQNSDTLW